MASGFALRAKLEFREQRKIFDYWYALADVRQMPARSDIDPCAIRELLPHIGLIDITGGMHNAFVRLAGSSLRDVYGLELTGRCLGELEWGEQRSYWQTVYEEILTSGAPCSGVVNGPLNKREHLDLHWLRLPLSDDGFTVNKILCHDIAAPSAVGISHLQSDPQRGLMAAG